MSNQNQPDTSSSQEHNELRAQVERLQRQLEEQQAELSRARHAHDSAVRLLKQAEQFMRPPHPEDDRSRQDLWEHVEEQLRLTLTHQ